MLVAMRPARAMRSHSLLPLPVVPATRMWERPELARSAKWRLPDASTPSGTLAEPRSGSTAGSCFSMLEKRTVGVWALEVV